jgi:hypothetical protein
MGFVPKVASSALTCWLITFAEFGGVRQSGGYRLILPQPLSAYHRKWSARTCAFSRSVSVRNFLIEQLGVKALSLW